MCVHGWEPALLGPGKATLRAAKALGALSGGDMAAECTGWESAFCPEARASCGEGPAAGGCRGTRPRHHVTWSRSGTMGALALYLKEGRPCAESHYVKNGAG